MKEDDVVVVSSDSEEEEEIVWMRKNQNKQYQLLSEKIKPILYYQVLPGYKLSTSFPYAKLQELANDLKDLPLVNVKSTQAFIWKNVIRWLLSIKLCYENISDCINDKNYNLILTDFMAQYVNYKCQLYSSHTNEIELGLISNEILVTLSVVFSGWVPGILMTLLKIQVVDEYRFILYPIFRKYLSNKHLHETNDLVSYLRLILCFRKWKKLAHFKEDKEIINEIAVGKSAKALRSDIIDLSIDPVLPKTVPPVNDDNRAFANISGLIGFAAKNQEFGTRILLINKTLELDDTIELFFKRYNDYINRTTPKLLEWSRAEPKTTLVEDLTRSPSPDQLLPRSSCATQEISHIANKNKSNEKYGTKAVNQHLSNNCDIPSISVNNKFNHLNLNSHNVENLSPSCKNIPQNRNNDVVLSFKTNNLVDLATNDEDDNNEKDTSASDENSKAKSMNSFEKRIADALDRLKNRAINVGVLVNRVNVDRINSPVVAAISSDESDQFNAELPEVQVASNNVEAPIVNPVAIRASVNPLIEKPIRKRHGIVSSTTSFEGTGDDSDNSDDDDGFGVHNRFHFSQRSFSKVVEEATSSTNEIPKSSSNASNRPRRSISSSPCPTRPSTPSPDRWSNISPSSTIRSGSLSRVGIATGTSITAGRTVSSISDEEQPTCSRYISMPVLAASLPTHEDTSNKATVKDPPLAELMLIDTKSNASISAKEIGASATDKSQSQEDKCSSHVVPSDHTRPNIEVPIIDKSTVSKVDTDTCSVNELLKNISGFIGDFQEEYGFENSKNKCGPDKPPEDTFKTPTAIENESNENVSSKKIEGNLSHSDKIAKNYDFSFENEDEEIVKSQKSVDALQQPNVLPDENIIDNTETIKLQENCADISKEKNSREDKVNEGSETERFVDKPAVEEPSVNKNLPELNIVKTSIEDDVVKIFENNKVHEQLDEVVKILAVEQVHGQPSEIKTDTISKFTNEQTKNQTDTTEKDSNLKHEEIVDNKSKPLIEKSKSFEDEETLFEAIVEDGSLIDDIESPPYELICQNEILDIVIEKSINKDTNVENDDSKNIKTLDLSLGNTSAENKRSCSEKTPDKENKNIFIDINHCQPEHLEKETKRKTKEKVFETEETVLTNKKAKNEMLSDSQAQIIVKTVDLNQKQVNINDFPKRSEDEKLQIEEIIKCDHDYVTVKYSDTSRNDQTCDKQILVTFNATSNVSNQENKSKHREINQVIKLQSLEKEESSYEDTDEKVNDYCQKDESLEDLTIVYDTILFDCKSDGQPVQEDIISKQLPSDQQAEDEDFNNIPFKKSPNSVHGESIEEHTCNIKDFNKDQFFEKLKSCHESLIDKTVEKIENQTSITKEIEKDQCVATMQLTSDQLVSGFNCEHALITNDEDETENRDISKPIEICASTNQKNETTEKHISFVDDIDEQISFNKEITCNSSVATTDIPIESEKNTENKEYKKPRNTRSEIDEAEATQSVDVTKSDNDTQISSFDIITPIRTETDAEEEVTANIEDVNRHNKEPLNTSEAIERKETLDVKIINENRSDTKQTTSDVKESLIDSELNDAIVLSAISTDKKDEVEKEPLKIISAINITNVEDIEKQTSYANEIEENQSVTRNINDINATATDKEFNGENELVKLNDTKNGDNIKQVKICQGNDKSDKTIEKQTYNKSKNLSVIPIDNKHNDKKDTNEETLYKVTIIDHKDEATEKRTADIKEIHGDQFCTRTIISKEDVIPVDTEHKTESIADNEHNSQKSCKAEPPKLSPEIEQKVISIDTSTQNACVNENSAKFYHEQKDKMEMISNEICGSIISTKNISEVQENSSSPPKVLNLEVHKTQVDRSFLPPEIVDGKCLGEQILQDKAALLSLSPSSRIIHKSRPSQFQMINNEVHPPIKDELRRKLIIRIPKLSILEDELFKKRPGTGKDSVCKIEPLEEQKQLTPVEHFNANHIEEEASVKKNDSKKNKSSKKSDRKKIKKAKKQEQKQKQALEESICEDKVKEPINLPIKDSKITPEEEVFKLNASITFQTENKKTSTEENADEDQNEKTKPVVSSKNVKEDINEAPLETLAKSGENMRAKLSKNKSATKKLKQSLKPNISEEEIKILTKIPINDSKSLPEGQVIKLDVSGHIDIDHNHEAIDKTVDAVGTEHVIYNAGKESQENRGPLNICAVIEKKDEATTKEITGVETIDENKSLNRQIYSGENVSLKDIKLNDEDNTENAHKKPLNISLVNVQNNESSEQKNVDFEEIHEDQSGDRQTNLNKNATPNHAHGQDEITADSEHYLENTYSKNEPLIILPAIEQKVNFADTNAQSTRKELSVKNPHESEDKIEIVSDEIHSSLSSTKNVCEMQKCSSPLSKIVNNYPETLTAEVKSSLLSLKAVDVEPFGEEKMQEISIHNAVSSLVSSSESIDQIGLSPDQPRKKLIIRIPKLSGCLNGDMLKEVELTASVAKSPTLHNEENSCKYQTTEETSLKKHVAKKNKSSKKSHKNKIIKADEPKAALKSNITEDEIIEPIQNSTSTIEEQVFNFESSESMNIQIKNQITASDKNASKDHYKKTKPKLPDEIDKEVVNKDAKKQQEKKSTKKSKDINKRKQSLQSNIVETDDTKSIPTKDLKLSSEEQVLNLDASKSLTTSIESDEIKHDLNKSVIIEDNTICRDKLLRTLKNKKSGKKSNQSALNKANKPKLTLKTSIFEEETDKLKTLPTKNSTSYVGDEQVIRASECISFQIESQKIAREELNKPKVIADNVIEHKSFVKAILEEYMKESAVKKNTAASVEILGTRSEDLNKANDEDETKLSQTPTKGLEYLSGAQNCIVDSGQLINFAENCLQPKRKQKLNSKHSTEIFTEEPISKKNKTQSEAPNSYEPIEIFPLSILKRSTEKDIFSTYTGAGNYLPKPIANSAPIVKKVKFAECQTEPKSTIKKNDQPCSSKCQKFNDATLTGHFNTNKCQTNVLKNIVQCKDELIKNRNQQVFSQIRNAKQKNSIEPDSSSQLAKELQRTENILTEEESNLSTKVQVAFGDLGEPSLISDSEISRQNDPIALESDSSIVFYPTRDSAEDREVSFITSQKNDDEIYYNFNDENGTPVLDEKNLIEDESPSNQSKVTSLSKIKVPTADVQHLTPVLLSHTPQLIEPILKSLSETSTVQLKRRSNDEMEWNGATKPKDSELKSVSNDNIEKCNINSDEPTVPFCIDADENLELWYKKRGISKKFALNRGLNDSNLNSTNSVENSMENPKNDRKQKKPRRVQKSEANIADQKSFNFEDFKAAAILTSLKTRQNKTHRSRKGLQPVRITRSTSQMVELAETFLQHDTPPMSCSENVSEKDRLDNLNIIDKCKIPSSIENHSELTQSNGSSDSDDTGKLVIDFDPKRLTKSKAKEKSKSKSKNNKKGKCTTSSKSALKKNKKAKNKVSFNPIVELCDENPDSLPKRCRGRPKLSNELSTKIHPIETTTKSIRETPKQNKSKKSNTKNVSFQESKTPIEQNEVVINKSLQTIYPENKDNLQLSIDVPIDNQKDSKLTDEPNEKPSTSSYYESFTNSSSPHNMNKETWLKNLTLRKVSKSLDTDKEFSEKVSMVKRVLSEPNLFRTHKTIDFLKIQKQASENVSKMLVETNKVEDDQNKTKSKHDMHEEKEAEIPSLKVPIKDIETKVETLKIHKKSKGEKLSKCIRRLSFEEIKKEKNPKQPKKPKTRNEDHTTLKDQTASVITPTFETVYVEGSKQSDIVSKKAKSTRSNSNNESTKHSELVPENKIVVLPETNVDNNGINEKQNTSKDEEIKTKKQIKSITGTLNTIAEINSLNEVEKQVILTSKKANKSTKKAINKLVSLKESQDKSLSSMGSALNEEQGIDSNELNSINNPKSHQRIFTDVNSPSTDSPSKMITDKILVDQPKKELIFSTDETKCKSSGLTNAAGLDSTKSIEMEVEIPSLKVPLKDIEKKSETLGTQNQLKNDKTNKCIQRLSTQENNQDKITKQHKKQIRTNEEHTNLEDQTASVTLPTFKEICVNESIQIDAPSVEHTNLEDQTVSVNKPTSKAICVKKSTQIDVPSVKHTILEDQTAFEFDQKESIQIEVAPTVKPTLSNSVYESTNVSVLLPENKTASLHEVNTDKKVVKDEQKTAKDEKVENIELIKSFVKKPTGEISSLNLVDKQDKSTPNKTNESTKKVVDFMQSGDSVLPSRVSTFNEEESNKDTDSNDVNLKENHKSFQTRLTFDTSISSDPSSRIFEDPAVLGQHKKKLISSTEEVKLKISLFSNNRLEAIISKVGTKKHRSKSINLEKNEFFDEQDFLNKRLRRFSLDNPKNISSIERDTQNLINFAQVSKSIAVKTPTKKEDEVKRALDISISNILGTQLSNETDIDPINVTSEEGKKQGSEISIVPLSSKDNKQIIKKSAETPLPKRKRPSLDGVQCLVNVSVSQRRRSNSTSDVPNTLSGESVDVAGCEKDQETLKNRTESEAKKARVLSFTNFLELERDFFLDEDEMNAANFNDTREVQSSQVVTTRKAEPQHDCMFSGNRGQDDEDKLLIFNTDLALETVPTYSPDENVDLYSLDDLYLFTPASTLINGTENVSGGNSENGEKPKTDNKKTEFTSKEIETMISSEKATFDEGICSAIEGKQTVDVRTSEDELNDGTANTSCLKTKLSKSLLVKLFNKTTTPDKKNSNEEAMESIPGSKLKSRQKPFWKPIKTPSKPKIVQEASESNKLESSTSVISLATNPYPIDDVKSLPVYFEEMFEEKLIKTPSKSENQTTDTDLCKVDLSKKQFSSSLSTDDRFDRLKNESPVNKCVEKSPKLVLKPTLSLKPDDNPSKDSYSEILDVSKTQPITFVSSIPSELCEQKGETKKLLPPTVNALDHSNLFSDTISHSAKTTASFTPTDETQSSVLETNIDKVPCLLKEIDDTTKDCEETNETDIHIRNIVLLEDNSSYSKKPMRQSRIPSVKNSPDKVDVICEEKIFENKSTSKLLTSKTHPTVAVVSSMPSISTSLVTPTILDPLEHKVSGKDSSSKKILDQSSAIKTSDPSDKINKTQPTPENTNVVASKPSLKRYPSLNEAKNGNEPPSKIFCSGISGSLVQVAGLSSMPSNPTSSITPKILDSCEQNSSKISCAKKNVKLSSVIKSPDASVKTTETQPTPENKNVEPPKTSFKRYPSFSDGAKVQENPSKIVRSEISAKSISLQQQVFPIPNTKSKIFYCNPTTSSPNVSNAPARNQTITKPSMLKVTSPAIFITRPPMSSQKSIEQPTGNLTSQSPRNSRTLTPMHTTEKSISISFRKATPSSTPGTTCSDKAKSTSTSFGTPKSNSIASGTPRSTVQSFGTPRSNNLSSSTPKSSTSFILSTPISRTQSALSADLAKLSADLERIKNDISKLPEVDYNFPDYRRRKSLHKELAAKQEELNELKKKQQEYEKHTQYVSKSHSERKPFDRDHQQHHHHQHRSSSQQFNNLKRKHDSLGQHSERELFKGSTSGHSSHVERPKKPNRVYVNKFSELDKINFTNKHDHSVDTNPEAKKLPPWDPKPMNADEIIRTLRRK